MTIMISWMSDTFLSQFQKGAERFGVKGGEDQMFLEVLNGGNTQLPRRKCYAEKTLRWRRKKRPVERDVERESGRDVPNIGDDILREEILDEIQSIEESVNEEVNSEMRKSKPKKDLAEGEGSSNKVGGSHHAHKWRKKGDEEGVDSAIRERRRRDSC